MLSSSKSFLSGGKLQTPALLATVRRHRQPFVSLLPLHALENRLYQIGRRGHAGPDEGELRDNLGRVAIPRHLLVERADLPPVDGPRLKSPAAKEAPLVHGFSPLFVPSAVQPHRKPDRGACTRSFGPEAMASQGAIA